METLRKVLEYARLTPGALFMWTIGGGWLALTLVGVLLCLEPAR